MQITTIGLDLAKQGLPGPRLDAGGHPVLKKMLRRAEVLKFFEALPPTLVGLEVRTELALCQGGGRQAPI